MKNFPDNAPPPRHPIAVPIIHIIYDIYFTVSQLIVKFPKTQRHALGQTCSQNILHLLENTVAAANTVNREYKLRHLENASIKLDLLKLLIRLCKDCRCLTDQQYLEIETKLHQIGRQLGGWLKKERQ